VACQLRALFIQTPSQHRQDSQPLQRSPVPVGSSSLKWRMALLFLSEPIQATRRPLAAPRTARKRANPSQRMSVSLIARIFPVVQAISGSFEKFL
jgi:hypothetical protein